MMTGLLFCLTALAQEPSTQPPAGPAVRLSLIVTDRANHSINDVSKDQIQVLEDKIPQTVSLFSKDDRGVTYGLAIDTSGSLRSVLGSIIEAARLIINNNRSVDETFIERFISSDKIETVMDFTSDKDKLLKSVEKLKVEGGQSAVNDAVYLAVRHTAGHQSGLDRRHALVLITDGEDRASYYSEDQLFELVRASDVQIFVIGIVTQLKTEGVTTDARGKAERFLNRLSMETGGRAFFPKNMDELRRFVTEIVRDLQMQYVIGYQSTGNTNKANFRSVEIKMNETPSRDALTPITRLGYFVIPPDANPEEFYKKSKKRSKP